MSEAIKWATLTPEERDRLIDEAVFGRPARRCEGDRKRIAYNDSNDVMCTVCFSNADYREQLVHGMIPAQHSYSQSMDASQYLIEAPLFMQATDEYFTSWRSEAEQVKTYTCTLHLFEPRDEDGYLISVFSANGSTPMEARCLAALAALGVDVNNEE